MFSDNLNENG